MAKYRVTSGNDTKIIKAISSIHAIAKYLGKPVFEIRPYIGGNPELGIGCHLLTDVIVNAEIIEEDGDTQ